MGGTSRRRSRPTWRCRSSWRARGARADAQAKLAEARKTLPPSAAIHRAIGDVNLWAGRYEIGGDEYQAALKVDPDDLAARFKLGVTLRRMNKFDEAEAEFEKVAALDKEYPGLALERGLLYEASNRTQEALEFYQQALSKAPDDPDFMLRVGSAEVSPGRRPGRRDPAQSRRQAPQLGRGKPLPGARAPAQGHEPRRGAALLEARGDIDPNRAEYHLYVGWAANEAGQPAVARTAIEKPSSSTRARRRLLAKRA